MVVLALASAGLVVGALVFGRRYRRHVLVELRCGGAEAGAVARTEIESAVLAGSRAGVDEVWLIAAQPFDGDALAVAKERSVRCWSLEGRRLVDGKEVALPPLLPVVDSPAA
jgi:hypothetical protein